MNRRFVIKWVVLLPLLVADCAANVALRGSFHETMSARAHRLREDKHPYFGWTADAIDVLFFWEKDHCREQFAQEQKHGSVWAAWAAL